MSSTRYSISQLECIFIIIIYSYRRSVPTEEWPNEYMFGPDACFTILSVRCLLVAYGVACQAAIHVSCIQCRLMDLASISSRKYAQKRRCYSTPTTQHASDTLSCCGFCCDAQAIATSRPLLHVHTRTKRVQTMGS